MPDHDPASRRVQIGSAVCDFDQLTLRVGSKTARLEPRLAGVLAVLVQRAGMTLSRDELLSLAWDADASDEALTQAISRLRKLLGDRKAIETVPRVGYRLVVTVRDAPPITRMPRPAPTTLSSAGEFLPSSSTRWLRFAATLVTAAILGALLALWLPGGDQIVEREFEVQPGQEGEIEFIPQDQAKPATP